MLVWCSRAAARASRWNRSTCCAVGQGRIGQDLERDASAERLLLGLVDDAHAAPADLAEDAVVAEPLQPRRGVDGNAAGGVVGAVGAEVLHPDQDREDLADLVGELGVSPAVFLERGPLAAALAAEEVVGQGLDGVAVLAGAGGGHGLGPRGSEAGSSSSEPGSGRNGSAGKTWSMIRSCISGRSPRSRSTIAVTIGTSVIPSGPPPGPARSRGRHARSVRGARPGGSGPAGRPDDVEEGVRRAR